VADADGPPRAALIAALLLAVVTVGAVLAIAATRRGQQQPVAIPTVAAPHASDSACRALLEALPQQLGEYRRAAVAPPAPEATAAWQADDAGVVVLRCGLARPADFAVGSAIQVVDAVQWFQSPTGDRSTWYAIDRPVYVALTLPPGSGPTPIQQLSELIEDTITAVPIDPAPAG
jgi:hypothetical protein